MLKYTCLCVVNYLFKLQQLDGIDTRDDDRIACDIPVYVHIVFMLKCVIRDTECNFNDKARVIKRRLGLT